MKDFSFPTALGNRGRQVAWGLGIAGLLLASGWLNERPTAPPPEKTGLPVGHRAPTFELADQSGTPRSLTALLKNGPVALVFYRSADW